AGEEDALGGAGAGRTVGGWGATAGPGADTCQFLLRGGGEGAGALALPRRALSLPVAPPVVVPPLPAVAARLNRGISGSGGGGIVAVVQGARASATASGVW